MTLNEQNSSNIQEQREKLLEWNPDIIYGVYSIKQQDESSIELEMFDDVLTCYPNQLDNLQWLKDSHITIINIWELRKWKVEVLHWEKTNIQSPILLSNWVVEFVDAHNKNWDIRRHIITTLRDWGGADQAHRTTTAWRNSWDNLSEDLEREHIEESPFIWRNKNWKISLATTDNSPKSIKILTESIEHFIERKHLKPWHEDYNRVKNIFNKNFPWIEYDNLPQILHDIIKNNRIYTYTSQSEDDINWLTQDIKQVSLRWSTWQYYVFHDKENNTIEYRLLRTITGFNDNFTRLSKRPSRLYLESENQYPKASRVPKKDKYVPTIQDISKKIRAIL